jgi:hypothetical protein
LESLTVIVTPIRQYESQTLKVLEIHQSVLELEDPQVRRRLLLFEARNEQVAVSFGWMKVTGDFGLRRSM